MSSKTKIGAIIIGVGAVLGTVGGMIEGSIEVFTGIQALVVEIGVVLLALGIRDWPLLNKPIK